MFRIDKFKQSQQKRNVLRDSLILYKKNARSLQKIIDGKLGVKYNELTKDKL